MQDCTTLNLPDKTTLPEKKILLFAVNGSYAHSNLAVRCLRDVLEEAGYRRVELLEVTLRDRTRRILEKLVAAGADVYGFSCYIWNVELMLTLAEELKALCPKAKILFGGPECSFDTRRFTELPFVDAVLAGEGEDAVLQAMEAIGAGTLPKLLAGKADGAFPTRGIHYRKNEPVPSLVYYESSRGCPYQCAFCLSSATAGVRAKSAEKTLRDLGEFESFPGDLTVKLVDRTFNFDRERAKAIWRGLLNPAFTKCYHFEICAALLDEESFEILSRFPKGKVRVEIGLQSIQERTLSAVSRHTDAGKVLNAAKRLKEADNLHVHLDLIAGLPYETFAQFGASFDAAYPVCHVLQLGFLKLLHGTSLRADAKRYGMVFEQNAPYTVLKTDHISFEEMTVLHRVDELLERLGGGRFANGLDYLLPRIPSVFGFFCDFSAYLEENDLRELQKMPQRGLFIHLAKFGQRYLKPKEQEAFLRALRQDYTENEVRRPPLELGQESPEEVKERLEKRKGEER